MWRGFGQAHLLQVRWLLVVQWRRRLFSSLCCCGWCGGWRPGWSSCAPSWRQQRWSCARGAEMWRLWSLAGGDMEDLFSGKGKKTPTSIWNTISPNIVNVPSLTLPFCKKKTKKTKDLLLTSEVDPVLPVPIKAAGASAERHTHCSWIDFWVLFYQWWCPFVISSFTVFTVFTVFTALKR